LCENAGDVRQAKKKPTLKTANEKQSNRTFRLENAKSWVKNCSAKEALKKYRQRYTHRKNIVRGTSADDRIKDILTKGSITLESFKKLFSDWKKDDSLQSFGKLKVKGIEYYYIHRRDTLGHAKIAVFAFKAEKLLGLGHTRNLGKKFKAVKKSKFSYIYLLKEPVGTRDLIEEIAFVLKFGA